MAIGCAGALLGAAAAHAAETASQSFTNIGENKFVVPAGVTSVQVSLVGASGGPGRASIVTPAAGGIGATVVGTLAVVPGQILFVEVGGNGEQGSSGFELQGGSGGFNGGGGGAADANVLGHSAGGGGGGATDIRTCAANASPSSCQSGASLASRLIVAAGGGGGGGEGADDAAGGAGGPAGTSGTSGQPDAHSDLGGTGGSPAGPSSGGPAGGDSEPENPAAPGLFGIGGLGGGNVGGGGGGGGGGLFGGGGGGGGQINGDKVNYAAGGGGGGGSSGVPTGASGVSNFSTAPTVGQPSATFTWTLPAPTVTTGPASSVLQTSANLSGTVNPNGSTITGCTFQISPAPTSGGSLPCLQQVGSGSTPMTVSASATGLSMGTAYTVTLVAASAQGTGTGAPVKFETAGIVCAVSLTSAATSPCPGLPQAPPVVSSLRVSPARFRRGTRAAVIASTSQSRSPAKTPRATTIAFVLSQSARVSLSFERRSTGVMVGHSCVTPSKRRPRGRRCTLYTPVPRTLAFTAHAGTDRITFDGVLEHGARLSPGIYRLSLLAYNAIGSSKAAQHPTFTLLH